MSRPPSSPLHRRARASRWVDGLLDEKQERKFIIVWLICFNSNSYRGGGARARVQGDEAGHCLQSQRHEHKVVSVHLA